MKTIPPFQMPFDLSAMPEPTMEALDANLDYIGDYMKAHVFPGLIAAERRADDLEKRLAQALAKQPKPQPVKKAKAKRP